MKPFHADIVDLARMNTAFRKEVSTTQYSQIVLMSVPVNGEIGEEVHKVDQILVFVQGEGQAIIEGQRSPVVPYHMVVVPAGTRHNFITTGSEDLKLFTMYAPPQHKPGTLDITKQEADIKQD